MPTPEEFAKTLGEAGKQYDPAEELLRLERELVRLDEKYSMSSAEFFCQYPKGELGDDVEIVEWAGRYRLYQRLKQTISNSLNLVVTSQAIALT